MVKSLQRPSAVSFRVTSKDRADHLVHGQGLTESREQAKRLIMAGRVVIAAVPPQRPLPVDKPGHPYPADTVFALLEEERFVSRGAYKLLTALEHFHLDVTGAVCLDAGASTGGFTDCLLQYGAARVYAVDAGHGQLHERLRADARVINLERTNLRIAPPQLLPEPVDVVVADVSFISLTLILSPCMVWLRSGGTLIVLIKPQFEVGPHKTRKGVVRDAVARQWAVDKVTNFCARDLGLTLRGLAPSAILGPKGNQEYLAVFCRG